MNKIYPIDKMTKSFKVGDILFRTSHDLLKTDFYILSNVSDTATGKTYTCVSLEAGIRYKAPTKDIEKACVGLTLYSRNAHITINNKLTNNDAK